MSAAKQNHIAKLIDEERWNIAREALDQAESLSAEIINQVNEQLGSTTASHSLIALAHRSWRLAMLARNMLAADEGPELGEAHLILYGTSFE